VIFEPWKEHLFLDISSTNIDTLGPSLYQCVETHSIKKFWLLSVSSAPPFQLLRHQRNVCHAVVNSFTLQTLLTVNRKHFCINIFCIESFCPQIRTVERYSSVAHSSSTVAILTTETSLWLRGFLCVSLGSSTVQLHDSLGSRRACSITAVLLPFLTYSLTLPRNWMKLPPVWIYRQASVYTNLYLIIIWSTLLLKFRSCSQCARKKKIHLWRQKIAIIRGKRRNGLIYYRHYFSPGVFAV
jgi:hypothetical protein